VKLHRSLLIPQDRVVALLSGGGDGLFAASGVRFRPVSQNIIADFLLTCAMAEN
jgi:glycerate-2-kinase